MYNKILNTLEEIEEKENVKILYCVDAGSRAAGLSSPDSDYDVRFIYIRKDSDYLRLEPLRDVIEWQCDDTLDISGWDARKALSLGYRSNPSLLEWLYSPIVYKTTEEWQGAAETVKEYFSFKHTALHYLSIAKNNYADCLQTETVKYKKYFATLRPLLAAQWITAKREFPPVSFGNLTELLPDGEVKTAVAELAEAKRSGSKHTEGKPIAILNEYIENALPPLNAAVRALTEEPKRNIEPLNQAFLTLLKLR